MDTQGNAKNARIEGAASTPKRLSMTKGQSMHEHEVMHVLLL